jgi:hypothetical protein
VLVPHISVTWREDGQEKGLLTASRLADAASEAPGLENLLVDAMDDKDYPGCFPFARRTATDNNTYGAMHTGRITRWRDGERYGFLTDTHGQSWWLSKDSLLGNVTDIDVGTWVEFKGSPHPPNGQRIPTAVSVRKQTRTAAGGAQR